MDIGADDYLTKPFNTSELLARIRANLRKASHINEDNIFSDGSLIIDLVSRVVKKDSEEIKLTTTEYDLLVLFAKNVGKVLTHRYILKEIWGPLILNNLNIPGYLLVIFEKKIENDPSKPKFILTESGVSYRFVSTK